MDIVEQMHSLMGRMNEVTSRLSMIPWHFMGQRDSYTLTVFRELFDNGSLFKGSSINQFFFGYHHSPDIVKAFRYLTS